MDPIKFNATPDYTCLRILSVDGVFTPNNIQADTLPAGFYKYGLIPGDDTVFSLITAKNDPEADCSFISKEPLNLGPGGENHLEDGDWSYTDKPFDFEGYFGQKLSFDTQVEMAEAKRDAKKEAAQSKKRSKSKKSKEREEDDIDR